MKQIICGMLFLLLSFAATGGTLSFSQFKYTDEIDNKKIEIRISIIDQRITGDTCFDICQDDRPFRSLLSGKFQNGKWKIKEIQASDGRNTGQWNVTIAHDGVLTGERITHDGQTIPINSITPLYRLPFDIQLITDGSNYQPETKNCDLLAVVGIKIYDHTKLVQHLKTQSTKGCDVFTPTFEDYNFDGYPDISIPQSADINSLNDVWFFNSQDKKFKKTHAFDSIANPRVDKKRKLIYSEGRANAEEHIVDIYEWKNERIKRVMTAASTIKKFPTKENKNRKCRADPAYSSDTGKITWYPDCTE